MTVKQRVFGRWTLTALVVANMVGAGVFTTSGFALGNLDSPVRVLWAWILGALVALCGALSYGALVRLHPDSGGEYLYLSRAIHPLAGFIAGWISLLAGFTGAIAFAALTFVSYAVPFLASTTAINLMASALIALVVLLHAFRLRLGAGLQNVAVAIKVALALLLCLYAVLGPGIASWEGLSQFRSGSVEPGPLSLGQFSLALVWISFSSSGFNAAVYLAGEVAHPQRVIPQALLRGVVVTSLLYIALNTVFVFAPAREAAAFQEDIAAVAAAALGGETLNLAVRLIISLALFTSVSAMVITGPRVYAKMADDGLLPRLLRPGEESPVTAVLIQGLLAILVVWLSQLQQLLSYLGFTLGLSAAAAVASVFVTARHHPAAKRALPGYPWAPALYVGATLTFAALAATVNPRELLAAVLTIASGAALYFLIRPRGDYQQKET